MVSDTKKIKPQLLDKYNISEELFDRIIDIYCEELKEALLNYKKPEISVLWGTLFLSVKEVSKKINLIKTLIFNYETGSEKNVLTEQRVENLKKQLYSLEKVLKDYKTVRSEGKTHRHHKRKYSNDTFKSDNT